jgi:hypothetical protein
MNTIQKQNIHATLDKKVKPTYGVVGWWEDENRSAYKCVHCKRYTSICCSEDICTCNTACDLCNRLFCDECAEKNLPQVYEENNDHIRNTCSDCTQHLMFCTKEHNS